MQRWTAEKQRFLLLRIIAYMKLMKGMKVMVACLFPVYPTKPSSRSYKNGTFNSISWRPSSKIRFSLSVAVDFNDKTLTFLMTWPLWHSQCLKWFLTMFPHPPAFLKTEAAQLKLSNRGEAGHQNIIEENLNCILTFMINQI